jgi:hypothetical protein
MSPSSSLIPRLVLALSAFLALPALASDQAFSVRWVDPAPKSAATLRLAPGAAKVVRLDLGEADAGRIAAARESNAKQFQKRLQIGIGRPVPLVAEARARALHWQSVEGGVAAHWEVVTKDARAVRVGLAGEGLPAGAQVRFAAASQPAVVYGPFDGASIAAAGDEFWSPVLEGDRAIVEVFLPSGAGEAPPLSISSVSHLFANPSARDMEAQAKASEFCEVDFVCLSVSNDPLERTGDAIARMTFSDSQGTYNCTGTLLNTTAGPVAPYFYSAAHCISTQSVASTLTTHWFYERTGCGFGGTDSDYVQLPGGATLLYANTATDVLLLRLAGNPPSDAVYAGWNAAALPAGIALVAVHHPAGDLKKVSLGSAGGFSGYGGDAGDSHIIALWNSTSTGVTEGGSSGSGIFTLSSSGSSYQLRGGLHGGPSSCTASGADLRDYYSRFDRAYGFLSQYLNPNSSCSYALSPSSAAVGAGAGSGTFSVTASAGCTWSATSSASWLTTSSSGSGNGTVQYFVAANAGGARTGTITVGGSSFTVSQASGTSSSNYTGLWWKSDESGWGINFAHQGSTIFATLFTYDGAGAPLWLSATMALTSGTTYTGVLYRTRGPAIDSNPWTPVTFPQDYTDVGTMTVTFSGGDSAVLSYNVGSAPVAKAITRTIYGSRSTCSGTTASRAPAANYQDIWWTSTEPGWGVNVTHQDSTIFATIFTYDDTGRDLWLSMTGTLTGTRTYSGDLYRTTGPAFNASPFTPIRFPQDYTRVGAMTFSFTDGESGFLTYDYFGSPVSKRITRIVFASPVPVCQ